MTRRRTRWAHALLLAALLLAAGAACGRKAKPEPLRSAAHPAGATTVEVNRCIIS